MANPRPPWLLIVCVIAVLSAWTGIEAAPIEPGYDLLKTKKGEITLNNLVSNPIPLVGNPIKNNPLKGNPLPGLGNTDTIIRRLGGLPAPNTQQDGTGDIPIELVALSLVSTDPVDVEGNKFDVFVKLDARNKSSANAANTSSGVMKVTSHDDPRGGMFDIPLLNIFLQVDLIPIGGNKADAIRAFVNTGASASSTSFGHEPPPSYPTIPNLPAGNFYPGTPFGITDGVFKLTSLLPAQAIPEPLTLALVGTGLVLMGVGRRRGKTSPELKNG